MIEQRFQEILVELERFGFREMLDMTRERFRQQHKEEELLSFFELTLRFNWHKGTEEYSLEAGKIMPLLKSLPEENRFCLESVSIDPIVEYEDADGAERKFKVNEAWIHYGGDIQPHWQELHYRMVGGEEQTVSRSDLSVGRTIAQTSAGPLKVFSMSDYSLSLTLGNEGVRLEENNEYLVECFPGVEAAVYFDHDESSPMPNKSRSDRFDYSDPVPSGCRATTSITRQGYEGIEYTHTTDVRSIPCDLMEEGCKGGVFWNHLEAWGFIGGKMVVGISNPRFDAGKCVFLGLMSPGELYTFPIDDDHGDDETVHHGQVTVGWETVEVGIEIKDGVLMSVPDVEEFVVPDTVNEMHFQSLLTAPSLRKITLRAGVKRYWTALSTFHEKRNVKLDVVFEGSLQEWFDSACYLCNHIGRLVIQGKEYDFYNTPDLVIPEGVSRIGDNLFSFSEVLHSLVLPPEVTEVGNHAFAYCDLLQNVKVLGPASIGDSAFVSCHDLSDIYLADGVVSLGYACFDFLTKVESIFIPKSVERVLVISRQNNGSCMAPTFRCGAPSKPSGWVKDWNLAYFDPRFGQGHGYDYYHPVKWGAKR